eukprot:TRINITY_DN4318_c0_g1_i1.p1 TRINITY_DN4318_c0_g1~~TRINITY_DN4318_c0_g1_i1.p1  ORF type:complete len:849 (+),score=315.48 TRINITY_DN4318_c0_g1_i1:254-2800(+)
MLPNGDNYYLHHSWRKPFKLSKMANVLIESVAWDKRNTESKSTGDILIGSTTGVVYQSKIEAKEKLFSECRGDLTKVYDVGENQPITGLEYEVFPPAPPAPDKYFVMATTPTRIYQFVGGPTFEKMFLEYAQNAGFQELPGNLDHSVLRFYSQFKGLAKRFAWLTGPGVFHGALVFGSQNSGEDVMADTDLMPYPLTREQEGTTPVDLVVTEFHYLILYDSMLQAVSRLNGNVVHCEKFLIRQRSQIGEIRGIVQDSAKGNIFVYGEHRIWTLTIFNERGNVWKLLMNKQDFEGALQYCGDNAVKKDKVWCAQADHYYAQQNYRLAATYYGRTAKSFEEITLKFIRMNERFALQTYLLAKLGSLPESSSTQKAIICAWLCEIYLNELNKLQDENRLDRMSVLMDEFKQFLQDNVNNMKRSVPTIYKLISSHGRMEALLCFAELVGDFDLVVSHHLQRNAYEQALAVLSRHNEPKLYAKFAPELMHHQPVLTVNALLRATCLDPRHVIPALMRYDHDRHPGPNQAIRFLKQCVKQGSTDPDVHNYLISLLVLQDDDHELISFLISQEHAAQAHYDKEYALRLCMKEGRHNACVHIYSAMGLYEEAVELALTVDVELAKENADKPEDDEELRKKLWLKIAKHVVEHQKSIKQAMEFLNQCELLKIEDILPFFPDFNYIDDFKDAICHSLEDYNERIEQLKSEMDEATASADHIRRDIKSLRYKYGFVSETQKCDHCKYPVLARPFYLFPCQHVFHADCVRSEIMKHLSQAEQQRVTDLEQNIDKCEKRYAVQSASAGEMDTYDVLGELDALKAELDEIIAGDCLFCGSLMISSIDQPFTTPDEEGSLWIL